MTETFSKDFKKIFLLTFTKELIIHSAKKDIIKLQKIIESREQKRREKYLGENINIFTKEIGEVRPLTEISKKLIRVPPRKPITVEIKSKPIMRRVPRPILKLPLLVPEPILPSHLEYLKPIPTAGVDIDLFKLNPLIKDIAVRIIEANPDERVIVSGTMGTKPTNIVLSQDEIDKIIEKFSEFSKIPAEEGIYRVVVGNLILIAIISGVISSRFIIKKMIINPNLNPNPFENQQQRYSLLPSPINERAFFER